MQIDGRYAQVNGLNMYYGTAGSGAPLLLLHGGFGTVEGWTPVLSALADHRLVIMPEQQGHGRTADRDTPLAYETMADDTAALIRTLGFDKVDIFGYSDGGIVGLGVATRHPGLVSKLAILGANAGALATTYDPETYEQFIAIDAAEFNVPEIKEPYEQVAPDPSKWPVLVEKIVAMGRDFKGYTAAGLASIEAEVLIIQGDRDVVRPEHAVEMFRTIPRSRLSILPAADHFILYTAPDRVLRDLLPFLDTPAPG